MSFVISTIISARKNNKRKLKKSTHIIMDKENKLDTMVPRQYDVYRNLFSIIFGSLLGLFVIPIGILFILFPFYAFDKIRKYDKYGKF